MKSQAVRPRLEALQERATPAQVGGPNLAFGAGGAALVDLGGADDRFNAVLPLGDGRTLAAGTNGGDFVVALFRPNGTLDTGFGSNGLTTIDFGGADEAFGLALDAVGRPVVVGRTSVGVGGGDMAVARLTADTGVLDTAFGVLGKRTVDLGAADVANGVTIDGAGRILLAGAAGSQMALARLDAFGSLDAGFGANGIRTLSLGGTDAGRAAFVVPADNRIILVGSTTRSGGAGGIDRDFVAVKFTADGKSSDPVTGAPTTTFVGEDFGTTGFFLNGVSIRLLAIDFGGADELFAATADPNGRYLVAGRGGPGVDFAVARFDSNGNLDGTFGSGGKATLDFGGADRAAGVAVQPDGRIVLGGTSVSATGTTLATARLTAAGAPDATFNGDGRAAFGLSGGEANAAALGGNGDIVLAGRAGADGAVVRLNGLGGGPKLLLAGGPADGAVRQFLPTAGQFAASGAAFSPFPGVANASRVATADVNGDGIPDRIAVTGPGVAPMLAVYDGRTGQLIASQMVFEPTYLGGVNVSAGDINGDGKAEVVVSPDAGGGPRVRVLDGAALAANQLVALQDFFAITDDPNFRGGVRTAIGDIDGDGFGDLLVSAGFGGGPRIALWSGAFLAAGKTPTKVINDFFAFESTLRDGAFVAVGDVNGDNRGDLLFGGGPNGGPRVRVVSGGVMLGAGAFSNLDAIPAASLGSFFAGDPESRGGVRVAARDADGDGLADVVTGSGDNLPSAVRVYLGKNLPTLTGASPAADQTLDPFAATLPGGVFVG